MSTKFILLIIGIALVIIGIVSVIKNKNTGKELLNPKIGIALGIIGFLMIIFGGYTQEGSTQNSQLENVTTSNKLSIDGEVNQVKIISPVDQDSIDCRILTIGVYPEGHEKDIWVLVRPSDDRYYPQSDHTNRSFKRDGEWQVISRFGGDYGEAYDLIVYEASPEASTFFSQTIEEWKEKENYPGLKLSEIPAGAKKIESITVYSKKNCRGVF